MEDEWTVSENFKVNTGLHFAGLSVQNETYTSTTENRHELHFTTGDIALKASYADMMQFVNLLTNEGIGLPTDLWVPSTATSKPQTSRQYAAGLAKNLGSFEVSIEGYYKDIQNLVSYKEGANFLFSLNEDWEDKITQGNGQELQYRTFVQKKEENDRLDWLYSSMELSPI